MFRNNLFFSLILFLVANPADSSAPGSQTMEYRVNESGGLTSVVTRTVIVIQPLSSGALRFAAGQVIELPVIGTALTAPNGDSLVVPTTATAASINVTAVRPGGSGFITVWPYLIDEAFGPTSTSTKSYRCPLNLTLQRQA